MSSFIAYLSRLKYVYRWGLKRNTAIENDMEHSYMAAVISHMLAVSTNVRYSGSLDIGKVTLLAVFHDSSEVLTGDMPTPIKHFDRNIYEAYTKMEEHAANKLLGILPEDLRPSFSGLLKPDKDADEWKVVKAADRIAAYIKCMEEIKAGNREFEQALEEVGSDLKNNKLPAVADFMTEFAPSFTMTLDQLSNNV